MIQWYNLIFANEKIYFLVSVPPEIDDLKTSSDVYVNEGDEASLECHANGHPKPQIKWLREDKANITIYDRNNKRMIGEILQFS